MRFDDRERPFTRESDGVAYGLSVPVGNFIVILILSSISIMNIRAKSIPCAADDCTRLIRSMCFRAYDSSALPAIQVSQFIFLNLLLLRRTSQ